MERGTDRVSTQRFSYFGSSTVGEDGKDGACAKQMGVGVRNTGRSRGEQPSEMGKMREETPAGAEATGYQLSESSPMLNHTEGRRVEEQKPHRQYLKKNHSMGGHTMGTRKWTKLA